MTVLVIAEHDNTQLDPSTLHAVAAASQCANDVHVLVAGCHAAAVASAAASIAGVAKCCTPMAKPMQTHYQKMRQHKYWR